MRLFCLPQIARSRADPHRSHRLPGFVSLSPTANQKRTLTRTHPPQAFTIDGFLCAAILVYELVWKRRATVVKSSLVQQFVVVAMRSSGLVGEFFRDLRAGRGLTRRVQRSCSLVRL